jgi:Cft2 family RNA processing exonuclease
MGDFSLPGVDIRKDRTILLGKNIMVDGHDLKRKVAVITHAHGNACWGLEELLGSCENIFMSNATKDLLIAQKGTYLELRRNIKAIDYDSPQRVEGTKLVLRKARHILGSSQVSIREEGSEEVAYTGDFLFPDPMTDILKPETLVVNSTYGNPSQIRQFRRRDAEDKLVELVKRNSSRFIEISAEKGQLQEAMALLTASGVSLPYLCTQETLRWTMVYQKYGVKIGPCLATTSDEAKRIIGTRGNGIFFRDLHVQQPNLPEGRTSIRLSGSDSAKPYYEIEPDSFMVTMSDSADFAGTMDYIRESKPHALVADNSRGGDATSLATEARRLGLKAYVMPQ